MAGEGGLREVDAPVLLHVGGRAVQLAADVAGEQLAAVQAHLVDAQVGNGRTSGPRMEKKDKC